MDCGDRNIHIGVETVEYRGWKGYRNGVLLQTAASHFDVFVTMDDNLPDQQNLRQFDLAVVVLRARSKNLEDLLDLMPELARRLPEFRPGEALRGRPRFVNTLKCSDGRTSAVGLKRFFSNRAAHFTSVTFRTAR